MPTQSGLSLSLRNTAITDKGLKYLQGLPNIAGVDVTDSNVTQGAIREFRRWRGLKVDEPSREPEPAAGPEDSFDGINVATPNVLAGDGKYWLFCQAGGPPYRRKGMNVIGMSWST